MLGKMTKPAIQPPLVLLGFKVSLRQGSKDKGEPTIRQGHLKRNSERFWVPLLNQLPPERLFCWGCCCASTLFLIVSSLVAFKLHHKSPKQ